MTTINRELTLTFPEGFHEMTGAELSGLRFIEEGPAACFANPDRHMIVTVGWKEVNMLKQALLIFADPVENMKGFIQEAFEPYSYRFERYLSGPIGTRTAGGLAYGYTAQDIRMVAEAWVLKSGGCLYYFNVYTREALRDENLPVWRELLASAQWA